MSDTLQEREDQIVIEDCKICGYLPHMPWCDDYVEQPSMTDQDKIGVLVNATGEQTLIGALRWIQNHRTFEHQPAARGGGGVWDIESDSLLGRRRIRDMNTNRIVAVAGSDDDAQQILREHNQHHFLVAERERLREALGEMLNRFYPHTCDRGPLCAKCGALRAAQSVFNETDNQQRSTSE